MIGKDNFRSVESGKVSPLCCTAIFTIDGVKCNTSIVQRSWILSMLLLAAGHIKFIFNVQLQLQYSSFCSAKIIQKHIDTYYSSIFEYILFIFIIHSNIIAYYSNISCTCTFKNLFKIHLNRYIIAIINTIYNKFLLYNHTLCLRVGK